MGSQDRGLPPASTVNPAPDWASLSPVEIKRINFPAGADVQLPGFDGQLETSVQSHWIPEGRSVWELSVQGQGSTKARKDYVKRRDSSKASERAQLTYVAVSARRWKDQTKQDWIDGNKKDGWKEVHLLTAVELAEWLERAPALAVSFAAEVGRLPPGVMPLDFAWKAWSQRSNPATTTELVLVGRAEQQTRLIEGWLQMLGLSLLRPTPPTRPTGSYSPF
jgi:hypothetical protein